MGVNPGALTGADAVVRAGVARGRVLFNRGDFWGSHEAWEAAWHVAEPDERVVLQGLIQAGAAFHKLVVQDNAEGARRLLAWSTGKLDGVPDGRFGLALAAFRSHLHMWSDRLAIAPDAHRDGPIVGLPYLEWSPEAAGAQIRLDAVRLFEVQVGHRRAVLVAVDADGLTGWGECRMAWETHGVWSSLTHTLAPALLTEPVAVPSELRVLWAGVSSNPGAEAGLEAALWDLWAQREGCSLAGALGVASRDVALAARVRVDVPAAMAGARDAAVARGYRHLVFQARPNADRRVIPRLVRDCPVPFALDLGGAYRAADIQALQVLDRLGARWLGQPVPLAHPADAVTLARWLETPVAMGGFTEEPEVDGASALKVCDAILVDPGLCGLTEAVRMAEFAHGRGIPASVDGSAVTTVGAAADLALAAHPGIVWPSAVAGADTGDVGDGHTIAPDGHGSARPGDRPGLGVRPSEAWLASAVARHATFRA